MLKEHYAMMMKMPGMEHAEATISVQYSVLRLEQQGR